MKKQIAILASIIAASGFTAFGQDWITVVDAKGGLIQDDFTGSSPANAYSGDVTVEVLWASTTATDPYAGSTAATGGTAVKSDITALLSGGWTLAQNLSSGSGSAALGTVTTTAFGATPTTKNAGEVATYNTTEAFEINAGTLYGGGATGDSGDNIQMLYLVLNGANTSYLNATALGISDPFLNKVGSSAGDGNSDFVQSGDTDEVTSGTTGPAQFFVDSVGTVPEPTTLALAGLGGLSMLFLRRRKA